jgi:hypothetical protein
LAIAVLPPVPCDGPQKSVVVALGVGRSAFDANVFPVGIEFVGEDGGQAGVGALAHFEVLGHDGDAVVAADFQKGVNFAVHRSTGTQLAGDGSGSGDGRQTKTQRQSGAALQETAAAEVFNNDFAHDLSPQASACAASWMAARTRT